VILQKGADALSVAVKIISAPQLCEKIEHMDLGRHGVILFSHGRSHYLFPGAASEHGLSKIGVLEHLCRCLAFPPGAWRDKTARIMIFETADISYVVSSQVTEPLRSGT
jgi:AMMECR1 domain-containing protein